MAAADRAKFSLFTDGAEFVAVKALSIREEVVSETAPRFAHDYPHKTPDGIAKSPVAPNSHPAGPCKAERNAHRRLRRWD